MKKFLAVLAALGISSTGIISVVACGNNNQVTVPHKQDIATLFNGIDLRIDGKTNMNDLDAFTTFSNLAGVSQILESNNLSQADFDLNLDFDNSYYTVSGMLTLTIKEENTNYTGSIDVIINPLSQTNLQNLDWIIKTIDGTNTMTTASLVLQAFLAIPANQSLAEMVKIKDDNSFVAPTTSKDGSLTIAANLGNQPYSGEVQITINKLIGLETLGLKTKLPSPVVNQQAAFAAFLKLNPEVSAFQDSLEITGYQAASVNATGSLTLEAKSGTRYSDTLTITIPELNKTNIATLVTNTTIQGVENMTKESAFQAFLTANQSWTNLSDYVKAGIFTAPKYTTPGTLKVETKSGTGFSGSLTVMINPLGQTDLNSLDLVKEVTTSTTKSNALATFLSANSQYPDLKDYVKLDKNSFVAPTYNTPGSYVVMANTNGKYRGSVAISISPMTKIALNTLGLKTTLATSFIDQTQAFNNFISLNSQVSDLKDNVEVSEFTPSNWDVSGKLSIQATANGKYRGNVDVTIPARQTIALTTLNQTAISGSEGMNQATAWQAFLSNNPNVSDLEQYTSVTFTAPDYNNPGQLVITANSNGKYTGTIIITINAVAKINLSGLTNLVSQVPNNTTKATALVAFLNANSRNYPDLEESVELDENSFTPPTPTSAGHYTIRAKAGNYKYQGTVEVTISKTKVALSSKITTVEINQYITNKTQVIAAVLKANPNSGVGADDLEVVANSFKPTTISAGGEATIRAVDSSGFVGTVNITIIAFPKDQELLDIIKQIKDNGAKNSTQIDLFRKRYFPYYSQQKLQYMVDTINTQYTVPKEYSLFDQRMNLLDQVTSNMKGLLTQVVIAKDGLTDDFRYDKFEIFSSRVNPVGDNVLEIQFNLNFIWEPGNGISSETFLNVSRTIRINYSVV